MRVREKKERERTTTTTKTTMNYVIGFQVEIEIISSKFMFGTVLDIK